MGEISNINGKKMVPIANLNTEERNLAFKKIREKNSNRYYDNSQSDKPRNNVKYFIDYIQNSSGNAIDLGCGAGNDTVYLIKNNWNVLAIDREDVEKRISNRLSKEELKKFKFQIQDFENLQLEESNLIVSNYSLPFCNKEKFKEMWNKIKTSILPNGYFVGNFFGQNDDWYSTRPKMTFLTKEQVVDLFKEFEIIRFKEIEEDKLTGLGKMKHWHTFNVIAKRK